MDMISSRISLYDFLSILTTGFLWLFLFLGKMPDGEDLFFISVTSYLVGMVYHWVMECTLGKLIRNHPALLRKAYKEVEREWKEVPMKESDKASYYEAYYLIEKNDTIQNFV